MENFLEIRFRKKDGAGTDIIIAELMAVGCDGIDESEKTVKAYFSPALFAKSEIDRIFSEQDTSYQISEVENKNWNAEWEKSFDPVLVGNFAAVRASFHEPVAEVVHEIIITPKMSFGTGHHATTFLMMEQMQHLNFVDKTVFDFGTGTGVLAILAEKLGAARIIATDNDEWSINNAIENLTANQTSKVQVALKDDVAINCQFDLILANINKNTLLKFCSDLFGLLRPGGKVLLSGILETDETVIKPAYESAGYRVISSSKKDGWLCLLMEN